MSDKKVTGTVYVFDAHTVLVEHLATDIAQCVCDAIIERGVAYVALSGGKSPGPVYRALARCTGPSLDWSKVEIFLADERCVPVGDEASNYRMIEENFVMGIDGPRPTLHRIRSEASDLEAAADDYAARLPERLDLVLLGCGSDCHTASLFPGSPAIDEERYLVVPTESPVPPLRRLTITPPVIQAARSCFVLATGADKARAVLVGLTPGQDVHQVPVALARDGDWYLDAAAAELLSDADD